LLDRLAVSGAVAFPEDLLFFRKAVFTLADVLQDVSPDIGLDDALTRSGLSRLQGEWLARVSDPFGARRHGTHLSNADLLGACLSAPLAASRFCLDGWLDALSKTDNPRGRPLGLSAPYELVRRSA
jgi:hypothetical protein